MGVRCGVDIVEIGRIQAAICRKGERFISKIFTESEIAYCNSRGASKIKSFAARFAAKEAVSKALGTGIGGRAAFLDIEIQTDLGGAPSVFLRGAAAKTFSGMNGKDIAVSLAHEKNTCVAYAIILTE